MTARELYALAKQNDILDEPIGIHGYSYQSDNYETIYDMDFTVETRFKTKDKHIVIWTDS